jgi:hypothetical protein
MAEETMNHYYEIAMKHLNLIQVAEENKAGLTGLAAYLMDREV